MEQEVARAFTLLANGQQPVGAELVTREVPGRLNGARVAVDSAGLRHLLVPVEREVSSDHRSVALSLSTRGLEVDGEPVIFADLACMDRRLSLVFERLVADVLARIANGTSAERAFPLALDEWRDLFRGARNPLTIERVVGLIGELALLMKLGRIHSPEQALDAWWGPDGHPHDFYSPTGRAIEVKATRSLEGNRIHVSNLIQLDPEPVSSLHLVVCTLRPDRRAATLDGRIKALLEGGFPVARTLEKIADAGHVYETPIPFDTAFAVMAERWWAVSDEFPGIRESRLESLARRGVSNVSYELTLDSAGPALTDGQAEALLEGWFVDGS